MLFVTFGRFVVVCIMLEAVYELEGSTNIYHCPISGYQPKTGPGFTTRQSKAARGQEISSCLIYYYTFDCTGEVMFHSGGPKGLVQWKFKQIFQIQMVST